MLPRLSVGGPIQPIVPADNPRPTLFVAGRGGPVEPRTMACVCLDLMVFGWPGPGSNRRPSAFQAVERASSDVCSGQNVADRSNQAPWSICSESLAAETGRMDRSLDGARTRAAHYSILPIRTGEMLTVHC